MEGAARQEERLAELRALVEDTAELEPGTESDLREERERLRHLEELVAGATQAAEALAPDDGDGAAGLAARAERAVAPLESLAPELARAGDDLRDVELRLRETASELRSFLASLAAEPGRLEQIESELERISDAKRRFRCDTYDELLARAAAARAELEALDAGVDPAAGRGEGARRRGGARARPRRRSARGEGTGRSPFCERRLRGARRARDGRRRARGARLRARGSARPERTRCSS